MTKKHVIYGSTLGIILIGGLYAWNMGTPSPAPNSDRPTTSAGSESLNPNRGDTSSTTPAASSFTTEEVAKHNDATSCYAAINGNVYDLTTWINQHPGGKLKILAICGRDGSVMFNLQHAGDKRPNDKLVTFKIGTLTQ